MKTWGKLTLLTLLASLCLAACGEKKTVHKIDWQTAPAYLSEDVALPVETCALNGSCTDGERIYYLTETRAEGARNVGAVQLPDLVEKVLACKVFSLCLLLLIKVLRQISSAGTSLALLPDGTVAALTVQSGGKREVRTLDPAAKGWGKERWEMPGRVTQIYPGSGGFLFYYKDRDTLWAWEPEGLEGRELLELSAGRLDSGIMCFAPLEEGRLMVLLAALVELIDPEHHPISEAHCAVDQLDLVRQLVRGGQEPQPTRTWAGRR